MTKQLIAVLFLMGGIRLSAQNLVLNPSFENTSGCVGFTGGLNNWNDANSGADSCSSPDLFATCFPAFAPTAVPGNWLGYQAPHTGNRYAGIILYAPGIAFACNPFGNDQYREYIQGQLSQPLTAGQSYCVSFYVNLAGKVNWGVNRIGVYFSTTSVQQNFCTNPGVMTVTPQLQYSGPPLMDSTNWVQLTWNYVAAGGEQYLTIGNFNNNASTTRQNNNCSAFNPYAYYYIDDVNVSPGSCLASPLSATSTQTNVNCFGQCTGSASVTAIGGTGSYTYSWAPSGGNAATATNLCAGTYTCTINDGSTTTTASVTITQPGSALSVVPASQTNITCNGGNNGTASVTASGGTSGYSYNWTPGNPTGDGTNSVTGLGIGSWTCTVTDANGCTTTQTFNITQPPALSASANATQTGCSASTGTATTMASGGTGSYTYSWAPSGGNAATASNLAAGGYTCTITDANGCSTTASATVTTTSGPTVNLQSSSNVTCNAGNNGSATVNATGNAPFTYSWAPSGGNAATASNLTAGGYTCTITDANNCTSTQIVNITEPTAISASASSMPTGCSASTGSATATASGGTGTLTYSWAPSGGNAATANNLIAGGYTCTITDANGCSVTTSTTVTSTGGPTVNLQSSNNATCFGSSNGDATVNATGNGPFTYSWTPSGGSAATATGLPAGGYTCTIVDVNGCLSTQTATITEPTQVSGSTSATPATCGNNDGSASVLASGGTGAYAYSWSPSGGTGATENNIGIGNYTVTITDANGCSNTATVNVVNSGGPSVNLQSSNNANCFGASTGDATVNATGNGPFTYAWAPAGGNAATATGLSAGTYTCTITDANGCVSTQTVAITEPAIVGGTTSVIPASCGNNNGSASVTASGGTGSYTYSWAPAGGNGATASGLGAGSYTVTITDANGCANTATAIVTNSNGPTVNLQSSTNVTCINGSDGAATVNATGNGPFTYNWSPAGGTAATASGLGAGTYTCTITDANGCITAQTVTLTEPVTGITATNTTVPEDCGSGNGSATITPSGGTPVYTYLWSTNATTATISNVSAGLYAVLITDANGCTTTATVSVPGSGSATANAGASVTILQGQSTTLNGTGGGTYSWSPSTGLSCTSCPNPTASPTVTTVYTLTVTDSLGCTAADTITVYVDITCGQLYLPNAFSPNGDNENDVLYVRGNCIQYLEFTVYNRWGEKVFETTDPALGWDGSWRSEPCEAAVFSYVLRATLLDGTQIEKQGSITLVK